MNTPEIWLRIPRRQRADVVLEALQIAPERQADAEFRRHHREENRNGVDDDVQAARSVLGSARVRRGIVKSTKPETAMSAGLLTLPPCPSKNAVVSAEAKEGAMRGR